MQNKNQNLPVPPNHRYHIRITTTLTPLMQVTIYVNHIMVTSGHNVLLLLVHLSRHPPTRICPPTWHMCAWTLHQSTIYVFTKQKLTPPQARNDIKATLFTRVTMNHEAKSALFTGVVIDLATGNMCKNDALLNGSEGSKWTYASVIEIDQLVQGFYTCMLNG